MMDRDRSTSDIARGSTWNAKEGRGKAIVLTVNLGFVVYEDERGAAHVLFGAIFRRRFQEPYHAGIRQHFRVSLANLARFHAFFHPTARRLYARSATKSVAECYLPCRGRGGAVPREAIYIDTYDVGSTVDDFIRDLNDELAAKPTLNSSAA